MKRPVRNENNKYDIKGVEYNNLFGSRTQVFNGTAYKTTGLLVKDDLIKNKRGYIVSKKKNKSAKKENRLVNAGWFTTPGKFGSFRKTKSKKSKKSKKQHKTQKNTKK